MNTLVMFMLEVNDSITFGQLAGAALMIVACFGGISLLIATLDDGWPFKKK